MCKNEHIHEIDVIETAARQVCSDIKSKSTSSESTKRILAQVFGVYRNEVLHKYYRCYGPANSFQATKNL